MRPARVPIGERGRREYFFPCLARVQKFQHYQKVNFPFRKGSSRRVHGLHNINQQLGDPA